MGNSRQRKAAKRDPGVRPSTSRDREESMKEGGQDNVQNPRDSGTVGLGGESSGSSVREPGGVEGAEGSD